MELPSQHETNLALAFVDILAHDLLDNSVILLPLVRVPLFLD